MNASARAIAHVSPKVHAAHTETLPTTRRKDMHQNECPTSTATFRAIGKPFSCIRRFLNRSEVSGTPPPACSAQRAWDCYEMRTFDGGRARCAASSLAPSTAASPAEPSTTGNSRTARAPPRSSLSSRARLPSWSRAMRRTYGSPMPCPSPSPSVESLPTVRFSRSAAETACRRSRRRFGPSRPASQSSSEPARPPPCRRCAAG